MVDRTFDARAAQAAEFLKALPKLHERAPQPAHSGGLNPRLGQVFIDELRDFAGDVRSIETGAGNSTLLFMMLGCSSVTAIAPDAVLGNRIAQEAEARGLDTSALHYIEERSEIALPRLAIDDGSACEVAFIDGNHGWPSVFVDFCYLNMMLVERGLLFIDDVQIYACAQLMLLLRGQPQYEQIRVVGKMATFRKVVDSEFLPDWRGEPFITMNTGGVILG